MGDAAGFDNASAAGVTADHFEFRIAGFLEMAVDLSRINGCIGQAVADDKNAQILSGSGIARRDDNGNFFAGEQSLISDDIDGKGKGADIFISRGETPAFFVPSAAVAAGFKNVVGGVDDTDNVFKIDIGFHAGDGIDFFRKKKFDIFFDDLTLLSIFQGTLSGNAATGNEKHGTCGGRSQ